MSLYSGQDFEIRGAEGQASAIVNHLIDVCGVCGKGYHVVTDNFYTKVSFVENLFAKKTLLTGTVCQNSRGFPKSLSNARFEVKQGPFSKKNSVCLVVSAIRKAKQKQSV